MVMRPGYPSLTDAKVICEKAPYTGIIDHSIAFNLISQEIAEQRFKTRGELLYARFGNEVSFHVQNTISEMDGAYASLGTTSGTTANFLVMLALAGYSQRLASSQHIFGGTYGGQQGILANVHMKTDYFDPTKPETLQKILRRTKKVGAVFLEKLSNADNRLAATEQIMEIADHYGKPVIYDNTYTFGVFNPLAWGAQLSTTSLTKSGGGGDNDVLGGVIESLGDSVNSKWYKDHSKLYPFIANQAKKFSDDPDPLMGLLYGYCGSGVGTPLQAREALIISNGLQTLHERTEAYSKNAIEVADHFDTHRGSGLVKHVNHLSREDHPEHKLAEKYLPPGHYGSVVLVDLGSKAKAAAFINNSGFVGVHIMQNKLMVTHPETTTHRQYTESMRATLGVGPGVVRVTVGNEDPSYIIERVESGLYAARMAA